MDSRKPVMMVHTTMICWTLFHNFLYFYVWQNTLFLPNPHESQYVSPLIFLWVKYTSYFQIDLIVYYQLLYIEYYMSIPICEITERFHISLSLGLFAKLTKMYNSCAATTFCFSFIRNIILIMALACNIFERIQRQKN